MTNPIPTWRETLGNSPALVAAGAVGQAMQQEIDLLRVRLSEVEKDAARYRAIRNGLEVDPDNSGIVVSLIDDFSGIVVSLIDDFGG